MATTIRSNSSSENRKLRHLQGITIRNVAIPQAPSATRPRGKTIDDDALPYTLKSPAKALALREKKELAHSRSSSDLRAINQSVIVESKDNAVPTEAGRISPNRPRLNRLRRRSTMEWTGASPLARQKKLEDVAGARMLDSFFALHIPNMGEPIYISETAEKAMNPNFRFFDLSSWGPGITRRDDLIVKFFAKTEYMSDYQFVVELSVSLSSLQFIGKTLENFRHPLPENSIIFHLTDGIYTSFTNLPTTDSVLSDFTSFAAPRSSTSRVLPTSSYDALMRLATLDTCIQDAFHTRDTLSAQISAILEANRDSLSKVDRVPETREAASRVDSAVTTQHKRLESTRRRREELQSAILSRRDSMGRGRTAQAKAAEDIASASEQLEKSRELVRQTAEDIVGQRRRCCEELQTVYPIDPVPGKSLSFTIRGAHLPNSNFDDADESAVAAALGHVAQVVHLLSFYLATPLPYPISPRSSTSSINDPISETTGPRTYPLFLKGAVRFRFEYGVFLLNKDIEILANGFGLKLLDLRHTLPNLKYLLYITTAGKGELPARKAGGVRALLRARGESSGGTTPTLSRGASASQAVKAKLKESPMHSGMNGRAVGGRTSSGLAPAVQHSSKLGDPG
ncbi:UV radiation resistance-associated gene protein [Rhizodiscina lignyota]|uniref:Autophagy-related protein 14 n=1 Tax=Rhizodiscina lignyota TaxID=1504668 RepID=A0A9P4INW5_9PEZI|nr:UV radiation resistance-associated gene protein [Rhizodiscina lignyota]